MINNSVQLVCAWVKVLFGGIAKNGIRGGLASFFALRYLVSREERKEVTSLPGTRNCPHAETLSLLDCLHLLSTQV